MNQHYGFLIQNGDRFTGILYKRLLESSVEFQKIFRNSNLSLQRKELADGFRRLAMMRDSGKRFKTYLLSLGLRHRCYEIKEEHYPLFKKVFLESLEEIYGEQWKEGIAKFWNDELDFMTSVMIQGSHLESKTAS